MGRLIAYSRNKILKFKFSANNNHDFSAFILKSIYLMQFSENAILHSDWYHVYLKITTRKFHLNS